MNENIYKDIETGKQKLQNIELLFQRMEQDPLLSLTESSEIDNETLYFLSHLNSKSSFVDTSGGIQDTILQTAAKCIEKKFPEIICKVKDRNQGTIKIYMASDRCSNYNLADFTTVNIFQKTVCYERTLPGGVEILNAVIDENQQNIRKAECKITEYESHIKNPYLLLQKEQHKFIPRIRLFFRLRLEGKRKLFYGNIQSEIERSKKEIDYAQKVITDLLEILSQRQETEKVYNRVSPDLINFFEAMAYQRKAAPNCLYQ